MSQALPVSLYFEWQWWERHYQHRYGRPARIDPDWLDRTYLGRQRFLYEQFGAFGIGEAVPVLDRAFVSKVMPYHTELLPVALGVKAWVKEIGGYTWAPLPVERLRALEPVDLAQHPLGALVVREREARLKRYGVATQMIDVGSVANNAFMLRGPAFYADLLIDKGLAHHYAEVITETICHAYRFISALFGPIEGFALGNCNVVMMSPAVYCEMIRPYDIRCVEYAAQHNGQPPLCDLHHCNVKTEPFAEVYRAIPGLRSLQGSYLSDLKRIRQVLPGVAFSAMLHPAHLLSYSPAQLDAELERCLADGVNDLAIWDIDPQYGPEDVRGLLQRLETLAARYDRHLAAKVIPFSWEELDWEFPRYRPEITNA